MIQNVSKTTRLVILEETSVMPQNKMVCFWYAFVLVGLQNYQKFREL